ncbi:MAG: hypothetical protein GY898_18365 [Proteobacteria bacterium]|nr:hypothetical protein [Pseudomonadota bacterium]
MACRGPLAAVLGLLVVATACVDDDRSFAQFDGPTDVVILEPGELFEVPVALVTSFRSGRVTKLDLKRRSVLVEDSAAPWMPGPDMAFGADRALSHIALVSGTDFVDVWASDDFRDELVRAPWIDGTDEDGKPAWVRPAITRTTFLDKDGTPVSDGDVPTLRNLRVRDARAGTESWRLTWTGRSYFVEGLIASGPQEDGAIPGTPYETDRAELAFTVAFAGTEPAVGSQIVIDVDSGIESADAGGLVTELLTDPTGTWVFATVLPDEGDSFVSVWDATTFEEVDRIALPFGAQPESIDVGATDGVLWVADSAEVGDGGRVFRLDFVPGDIDTIALTELAVPEPAIDAVQGFDPAFGWLFVAAAYTDAIWTLDPVTGEAFDTNPVTPEVDPTHVNTIVSGLAASKQSIETTELDQDGTRGESYGIFATTFAGELYWIDAATGCQVFGTPARAHLDPTQSCATRFFDSGLQSDPGLVYDGGAERCVTTHACGGVTKTETWIFTFDAELQAYEVEGNRSGEQLGMAFEGERYTSDTGAISVLILPGVLPTTDGDRYVFSMSDGVLPVQMHELPGDPVLYTELFDDRSGPWFKVRERQIAVVPHTANDVVLWVDLQGQGINDAGLRLYQ